MTTWRKPQDTEPMAEPLAEPMTPSEVMVANPNPDVWKQAHLAAALHESEQLELQAHFLEENQIQSTESAISESKTEGSIVQLENRQPTNQSFRRSELAELADTQPGAMLNSVDELLLVNSAAGRAVFEPSSSEIRMDPTLPDFESQSLWGLPIEPIEPIEPNALQRIELPQVERIPSFSMQPTASPTHPPKLAKRPSLSIREHPRKEYPEFAGIGETVLVQELVSPDGSRGGVPKFGRNNRLLVTTASVLGALILAIGLGKLVLGNNSASVPASKPLQAPSSLGQQGVLPVPSAGESSPVPTTPTGEVPVQSPVEIIPEILDFG